MDELNDFLKANPNAKTAFDALIAGKDAEKEAAVAAKEAEKEAAVAAKEAEKEAAVAAKEAEKEAEKEAAVAAKEAEKEAEKEAAVAEIRYRFWLDERNALLNSRLSCNRTYRSRTCW